VVTQSRLRVQLLGAGCRAKTSSGWRQAFKLSGTMTCNERSRCLWTHRTTRLSSSGGWPTDFRHRRATTPLTAATYQVSAGPSGIDRPRMSSSRWIKSPRAGTETRERQMSNSVHGPLRCRWPIHRRSAAPHPRASQPPIPHVRSGRRCKSPTFEGRRLTTYA
jgi:hypothetical protein